MIRVLIVGIPLGCRIFGSNHGNGAMEQRAQLSSQFVILYFQEDGLAKEFVLEAVAFSDGAHRAVVSSVPLQVLLRSGKVLHDIANVERESGSPIRTGLDTLDQPAIKGLSWRALRNVRRYTMAT